MGLQEYALTGASVAGFLTVIFGPFCAMAYRHLHACIHRIERKLDQHMLESRESDGKLHERINQHIESHRKG